MDWLIPPPEIREPLGQPALALISANPAAGPLTDPDTCTVTVTGAADVAAAALALACPSMAGAAVVATTISVDTTTKITRCPSDLPARDLCTEAGLLGVRGAQRHGESRDTTSRRAGCRNPGTWWFGIATPVHSPARHGCAARTRCYSPAPPSPDSRINRPGGRPAQHP